jgi:hypothetical protein
MWVFFTWDDKLKEKFKSLEKLGRVKRSNIEKSIKK